MPGVQFIAYCFTTHDQYFRFYSNKCHTVLTNMFYHSYIGELVVIATSCKYCAYHIAAFENLKLLLFLISIHDDVLICFHKRWTNFAIIVTTLTTIIFSNNKLFSY